MVQQVLRKLFGTSHEREMKRLWPMIDQINSLEKNVQALNDGQLQAKTAEFKERIARGENLDSVLPEAFAVVREASRRVTGLRHYDVQMIGGMVLNSGKIAEMKTGEGKTLVATLPVYLNALEGKGVHVVTVNDYLAKRDAEWMGRIYRWLGMSVGIIVHELSDRQRRVSYNSDITYGTNNEFGFDYLRDNMKFAEDDFVQRPHHYAIVDECDSILVDEARTPLIISGPAEESSDRYQIVNRVIPALKKEAHFTVEEKSKTVALTEDGNSQVEKLLGLENIFDPRNIDWLHYVYQGLKAHHLYRRDVEYMVKDGQVVIVDEFTGRLMEGRRWSDGLHQAVEAKEGVRIRSENQTLATITFQNYFRMYKKLSGMTGTAETEAVEFQKIYNLGVTVIPTNRPVSRKDLDDVVYKTEDAKFRAIAKEIQERNAIGQPILVGTISIEKSERLSDFLKKMGVRHNVLNAKHHEREAEIVAQAGRKGAVTIATNMAGRGTDIILGGNPEFLAKQVNSDTESDEHKSALEQFRGQCAKERDDVVNAGGLCIIGTERHESRRIDNQLRGRAGRQGDPGQSKFYLSLDDHLMVVFNGERIKRIMTTLNLPEDEPITAPMVTRAIEGAQRKVEAHNFDIRKHLLDYDDVMNKQRNAIYNLRKEILEGKDLERIVKEMMGDVTSHLLDMFADENTKKEQWDLPGLNKALSQQFGVEILFQNGNSHETLNGEKLNGLVRDHVIERYEAQKKTLGPFFGQAMKMILLQSIDVKWKEHLQRIDHLRDGINLRAYGQKDPLIEYKREAFGAFEEMNMAVRSEVLEKIFKIQIREELIEEAQQELGAGDMAAEQRTEHQALEGLGPKQGPARVTMTHGEVPPRRSETGTVQRDFEKVGRNDPCPCGSGKKFKKCHGTGQ